MSDSLDLCKGYLNKKVTVTIDRPLGSKHPKYDFEYLANYGFIKDVLAPDGEELDAYYLGVDTPLEESEGVCIAIIHRTSDDDDKLVVVSKGVTYTDEEIEAAVEFQEKWFDHEIFR